jgi:hypothetical protein
MQCPTANTCDITSRCAHACAPHVQALLAKGANVLQTNRHKWNALLIASHQDVGAQAPPSPYILALGDPSLIPGHTFASEELASGVTPRLYSVCVDSDGAG